MFEVSALFTLVSCISFFLLGASFVLYPVSIGLLARRKRSKVQACKRSDQPPFVSLIVACYNEEQHIARKIENCLALNYPVDRLEILVFSDGSTDATDSIVESFSDRGAVLRRIEGRLGKTHCQNEVVRTAKGAILVFSDANSMYQSDAIRELVLPFDSADVGAVVGRRVYVDSKKPSNQEGLYERLENWMKQQESLLGGTIGANGSIYAVRTEDYIELPADRMSDIVEPLRVIMDRGQRVVFASSAIGCEDHDNDFWMDFKRKRRIVLRAMNSLWSERSKLVRHPLLCVKLFFHKVIRWFTLPLLLIGVVASFGSNSLLLSVAGLGVLIYLVMSLSILVLFSVCGGAVTDKFGRVGGLCLYSIGVFLSAAMATWDFLRGRNIRVWESRS